MSAGENWSDRMGLYCATCRYWSDSVSASTPDEGYCKRRSPKMVDALTAFEAVWPITKDYDWCGEYASAEIHSATDVLPTKIEVIAGDVGNGKSFVSRAYLDEADL